VSLFGKLFGVFLATTNHQPAIVASNTVAVAAVTNVSVTVTNPADPVEQEFQKLLAEDDAAQEEVDKWIRDNQTFVARGGGLPNEELNRRIRERLKTVQQSYENFLGRHPDHAHAYIAYGSFLNDTKDEEAAAEQWNKALKLDPKNPAVWNNLANYYGHVGPVTNAFAYYAKAIELNPNQSVYYHNLGTTVYLFRQDAMEYFNISEPQVLAKVLGLYRQAMKLAPDDFLLATDVAQTYYGLKPFRADDALTAWTNALSIARDENEREGVYVHLARIKLSAGNLTDARAQLDAVTNVMYADLKKRLLRNLDAREGHTNSDASMTRAGTNTLRVESPPGLKN
jgi:tetratricopeptide (TPR) repeat protein